MTVEELAKTLEAEIVTQGDITREVRDCYLCDMLSFAMAKTKEGDAWITVQTNINVVAVAALSDCACVIVPEEIHVEEPTIDRANQQEVTIIRAKQTAFEIARLIGENL